MKKIDTNIIFFSVLKPNLESIITRTTKMSSQVVCKPSVELCNVLDPYHEMTDLSSGTEININDLTKKIVDYCLHSCEWNGPLVKIDGTELSELTDISGSFNSIETLMKSLKHHYLEGSYPSLEMKWNITFEWMNEGEKIGEFKMNSDYYSPGKRFNVFTKPNKISDELCEFLGKPTGTELARSYITRSVVNYCKNKNLLDGQNIKTTDPALNRLLGTNESSTLSILTLQSYLKKHYVKESAGATSSISHE